MGKAPAGGTAAVRPRLAGAGERGRGRQDQAHLEHFDANGDGRVGLDEMTGTTGASPDAGARACGETV